MVLPLQVRPTSDPRNEPTDTGEDRALDSDEGAFFDGYDKWRMDA